MTTITIWLLVSLGEMSTYGHYAIPTQVVERFATVTECERVRQLVQEPSPRAPLRCIQATVIRP